MYILYVPGTHITFFNLFFFFHEPNGKPKKALLMMEAGVKKEWLAKWWNKGWGSPAVAMRVVTLQSVAFRAYALDAAVLYEGSTRGGTNVDAPRAPSGKKRGRPKSSPSSGPPKGARLFKGLHEVCVCVFVYLYSSMVSMRCVLCVYVVI